jgi:DNA-binding transcriptional LysR family regulator
VNLFDRSRRPPVLNAAGHALVPKARDALRAYDELARSVGGDDVLSGELVIGAMPLIMTGLVPKLMSALRRIYPELRIHVVPAHAAQQMPQLERGLVDTGLITQPPSVPDHLEYRPFAAEPLILLAPPDCPPAPPRELLARYPFIRFDRNQWVGQLIDNWLRAENIQVNEMMELDTIESVSNMVYFDLGITIVPAPCVSPPNPFVPRPDGTEPGPRTPDPARQPQIQAGVRAL